MEVAPLIAGFGSLASGAMQASNASAAGTAQANAYNYNAEIANNNAIAAQQAAAAQSQQQGTINNANYAHMEANMAGNGVDVNQGTPTSMLGEEAGQGKLAQMNDIYAGNIQATNFRNQAAIDNLNAANAVAAGNNTGNAAMLSGGVSGIGQYAKLSGQQSMLTSSYDDLIGGAY